VLYMIIGLAVIWHNAHDGYARTRPGSTSNARLEGDPRRAQPSPEQRPATAVPGSQFAE
jgi:hypothetical protein